MFVKVLGAMDILSAVAFLMLVFGMTPPLHFLLFCAGLLLMKGMFVLTGDVLSIIDCFSAIILLLSIVFVIPSIFLWTPTFLLLAKGFISFL